MSGRPYPISFTLPRNRCSFYSAFTFSPLQFTIKLDRSIRILSLSAGLPLV